MNWDYIAGFFDGEGSAGVYKSRKGTMRFINFSNTDRSTLEAIQSFIGRGKIALQRTSTPTRRPCYVLYIRRIDDLRAVIPELLPRCLIKGPKLIEVLADLEGKVPTRNRGRIDAFGKDAVIHLYLTEKLSISELARRVGVTHASMGDYLARHGIPKRTVHEAYLLSGRGRLLEAGTERIAALYAAGHTMAEIGTLLGVTHSSVWAHMRRHAIPTRTRHESRKMRRALEHAAPIGLRGGGFVEERTYGSGLVEAVA